MNPEPFQRVAKSSKGGYSRACHWLAGLVLALFVLACALPAMFLSKESKYAPGVVLLIMGWFPPGTIPWSANLMFLGGELALILRLPRGAMLFGVFGSMLALTSWIITRDLGPGYYVWQTCLLTLAIGSSRILARETPEPAKPETVMAQAVE